MMRTSKMQRFSLPALLLIVIAVLDLGRPAYAYLDPGTGSMLLQIILGGAAGVLLVLKLYWHRLKRYFGFKSSGQSEGAAKASEGAEAEK